MWETWVGSLGGEDPPGGGQGNPLQYSCLGESHGQRNLAGCYSTQGHKESNTTERLSTAQHTAYKEVDFLYGPVVKNPPANIGDTGGFDLWSGKIPRALEQLSQCITTTSHA